jgi:hypothetical protein
MKAVRQSIEQLIAAAAGGTGHSSHPQNGTLVVS